MPTDASAPQNPPFLAGLDAVAWDGLAHAYGPATDVPGLLRTLFSDSDSDSAEEAEEADYELWGRINHQGSVYPATPAAVPFLAAGAAARRQAPRALKLLAGIGESRDEHGLPPGAARRAVAQQAAILDPLLDDDDPAVRGAGLRALLGCGALTGERVEQRWSGETDPGLRASLLHALDRLDPDRAAALADATITSPGEPAPVEVRTVALRLLIRAGAARSPQLADLCESCLPISASRVSNWVWRDGPFAALFDAVGEHWGVAAALRLRDVQTAWTGPGTAAESVEIRIEGVRGLSTLAETYRSAATPAAERLATVLDRPDLQDAALKALRYFDPDRARGAADQLVRLATSAPDETADRALTCLVRQQDPRAGALLAAALDRRPISLAAVFKLLSRPEPTTLPFDPALLAAIRTRINELLDHPRGEPTDLAGSDRRRNEPGHLAGVLRGWGPASAPAIPELLRLLDQGDCRAAAALTAIGDDTPDVLQALRRRASTGAARCRFDAAKALNALAGDAGPLAPAIVCALAENRAWPHRMLDEIDHLGAHLDEVIPALEAAYLRLRDPDRPLVHFAERGKILAALAKAGPSPAQTVARCAAEISAISQVGRESGGGWDPYVSLQFLIDSVPSLGPAVRDLVPALTALLDHRSLGPEALRALFAVDPQSRADPQLHARHAAQILEGVTSGHTDFRAIAELAELGIDKLEPQAVAQLRTLVAQDRRVVRGPLINTLIEDDDQWVSEVRAVLSGASDAGEERENLRGGALG